MSTRVKRNTDLGLGQIPNSNSAARLGPNNVNWKKFKNPLVPEAKVKPTEESY